MSKILCAALFLPWVFTSCGTMKTVKETASNATQNIADFTLGRPKVAVVEAREKDMKQMPLGKERALAFDQQRKRSFWTFALPNFKEPTLPMVTGDESDGSLLPPKS
ncbi:MAG: hypothetical protein V4727_05100 [Verrucomicrobiota bacterium]